MQIVGKTEQIFVYAINDQYPFSLDEYYKILDKENDNPIGKIIETYEYSSIDAIKDLQQDIQNDIINLYNKNNNKHIYLAKLKIETELSKPIKALSKLDTPDFNEIKGLLTKGNINQGLNLGVIRGSESLYDKLPDNIKNISPMLIDNNIINQDKFPFIFNIQSFNQYPHLGLFGGSGSGKTYGFNVILEEIIKKQLPTIIFDPHYEMNFSNNNQDIDASLQFNYKDYVDIFQIGMDIGIPFSDINTEEFLNILQFAGNLTPPMVSTLTSIHEQGDTFLLLQDRLKKLIWLFEMDDKRELKEEELDALDLELYKKYKLEISSLATLKALQWRINSIQREQIFEKNVEPVRQSLLKRKTVVIRGSNKHLNMLASYMLNKFYIERRRYIDAKENNFNNLPNAFPPFIICLDEAHIFAPNGEYGSPTKNILKTIAQEGRKYGVYEILATQRPGLLDETIIAQLSSKIIFRTTISEDIKMIEKETNLNSNEINRLPYLSSGNAFVSSAIMGNTLSIRFRANFTEGKISIHPFDELDDFNKDDAIEDEILKLIPFSSTKLEDVLNKLLDEGFDINIVDLDIIINNMVHKKIINKESTPFGYYYEK